MAAALLLQLALGGGLAADRFPEGDTQVGGVDVDPELARHALDRHADMGVAEAAQNGLSCLFHSVDPQRRILRLKLGEGIAELVVVALGVGHDGHSELGRAAGRRYDLHRRTLRRQRIGGVGVGQLRHRGDVSRHHLGYAGLLLAAEQEQAVQPFFRACRAVQQAVVGLDRAGEHLEHRELADEGIGDGLEHVGEGLATGVGRNGDGALAGPDLGGAVRG